MRSHRIDFEVQFFVVKGMEGSVVVLWHGDVVVL